MSITYTRNRKTSQKEMLNTAKKLTDLIKMDTDKITERDKRIFGFKCIRHLLKVNEKRKINVRGWQYFTRPI